MKGIVLAGGSGTRLRPITNIFNKGLIPIHKKAIIDYPVETLISLGCEEITMILGGEHFSQVVSYFRDGADRDVHFNYLFQDKPAGISQAISLCEPYFKNEEKFAVILGDNLFQYPIKVNDNEKAQITLYETPEIRRFGCATILDNRIIKIKEKPTLLDTSCQNLAITGLYIFTKEFFEYFKETKPSARNEWEIVDIIQKYLDNDKLEYSIVDGFWLDAGTFEAIDIARGLIKE